MEICRTALIFFLPYFMLKNSEHFLMQITHFIVYIIFMVKNGGEIFICNIS